MKTTQEHPGPQYRLGTPGMGCFMDPPGHPSYAIQPVWTLRGNSPAWGRAQAYLPRIGYLIEYEHGELDGLYGSEQYPKEPMGTERWKCWEQDVYQHLRGCYVKPEEDRDPKHYGTDDTWTYTVDYVWKRRTFKDDPRFNDEWREKEKAAIDEFNKQLEERVAFITRPENHKAVAYIRKWYPDYQPNLGLIENPPKYPEGWYRDRDTRPTPEECPGDRHVGLKHKDDHCQYCGIANYLNKEERQDG